MNRKILIYRWDSLNEPSFIRAAEGLGLHCVEVAMQLVDYHADAVFAERMIAKIHEEKPDAVFSYDYFPLLSMICEINGIPYLSWIYDCPQYTLLSHTVTNKMNIIFCFDALYTERIKSYGAENVFHLPLAADVEGFGRTLMPVSARTATAGAGTEPNDAGTADAVKADTVCAADMSGGVHAAFGSEISFVGDLYNGEKNRLRHTRLPDYAHGYVDGLVNSQLVIYGYNLLGDSMKENVAKELVQRCGLALGDCYIQAPFELAADAVGLEVSARERIQVIDTLSARFPLTLYTGSELPQEWGGRKLLDCRGYADYGKEVPFIFRNSKINLNITSRTIESGIPQRVLDILGCGGFCMTNYQPEIAQYFEDGKELAMYAGMEELTEKTAYYLSHETERSRIAKNGYEKVKKDFALHDRIAEMINAIPDI